MKIRRAEIPDVSGVAELVSALSSYYLKDGQDEIPEWFKATITESAFSDRFNDPEIFNFVAELDGSIVGYISIKSGFHLYHLFVSSGFHNQGIARSLWQHCVAQLNIEQCIVRSSDFAIPVYSKFGFNIAGEREVKDGIAFQPMRYSGGTGRGDR
jgi:ribosomal protein S18 acetylase RimI-like enzyme